MLRVDDVLGSEVAVAERGDLRRRHVAARRLELCRAATHGQATATEQPPLPLRILRCCIKVKINLVLKILFGSLMESLEAPFSAIVVTYSYRATTAPTEISLALSSNWVGVVLTDRTIEM
jgi:hypothetical protein